MYRERGLSFLSMITPVEPETFKLAAIQLCQEAGVELLFHTVIDEVKAVDGHIEGLVVWNKSGRSLIQPHQYIDCSGDGDLAAYAGAPYLLFKPRRFRVHTPQVLPFGCATFDRRGMEAGLEQRGSILHLAHAVKPGMRQPDLIRLGIEMQPFREAGVEFAPDWFMASSLRPRELTYCNCINYGPNDGLDPDALTNAEVYLRGRMLEIGEFFRENIPGCEGCYVAGPAPSAGQRRGRAIRCEYELTQEDCVQARQFDDQIGSFSFIDNPLVIACATPWHTVFPTVL